MAVGVLRALADGPAPLDEVWAAAGAPPLTTLRAHLRQLGEAGIVERRRSPGFPGGTRLELTAPGRDLLVVAARLDRWLALAPRRPLGLGEAAATNVTRALVDAWSVNLLRPLAARPFTLTDLSRLLRGLSYPALERRLATMRRVGLLEVRPGVGRGHPLGPTPWLRAATVPLIAAARWEHHHGAGAKVERGDVEAIFQLAMPLVHLDDDASTTVRLVVDSATPERSLGMTVIVAEGCVTSCNPSPAAGTDVTISGSLIGWLTAVEDGKWDLLERSGDRRLGKNFLTAVSTSLTEFHLSPTPS
jgi:DNA-binding HxlR family transcriptional regulator